MSGFRAELNLLLPVLNLLFSLLNLLLPVLDLLLLVLDLLLPVLNLLLLVLNLLLPVLAMFSSVFVEAFLFCVVFTASNSIFGDYFIRV